MLIQGFVVTHFEIKPSLSTTKHNSVQIFDMLLHICIDYKLSKPEAALPGKTTATVILPEKFDKKSCTVYDVINSMPVTADVTKGHLSLSKGKYKITVQ